MEYLTDTTFLVDLWRERSCPGAAMRFAKENLGKTIGLPWVAKGEFLRGALLAGQGMAAEAFLKSFPTVWPAENTLRVYAELYGELRERNSLIGPNDLWVAATALELGLPLVTRNAVEFRRVPKLQVSEYAGA